jgi:alpha-N-arabinofuranosidase
VLQSLILTKDEKMVLTPTYHVFDMYKVHQDATLLPSKLSCADYVFEKENIPAISVSASRDKQGLIHISLCNLDPDKSQELHCELRGFATKNVAGRILTSNDMTAHNTFDKPETIKPAAFKDAKIEGSDVTILLPPKSVVVLEIR